MNYLQNILDLILSNMGQWQYFAFETLYRNKVEQFYLTINIHPNVLCNQATLTRAVLVFA